jgi:hypothetical protein
VHERDIRSGEHFADHGHPTLAVSDQDAVGDPAVLVVRPHDLLAVAQGGRVPVCREIAAAGLGVDEDRTALGVGTAGAGRRVGDEQHPLARSGFLQAAPQRTAAPSVSLHGQAVARFVDAGCPDFLQSAWRDRFEDKAAFGRSYVHDLFGRLCGHAT